MKALTVAQPWASLIVAGAKTIETRPMPPNGPMCPTGVRGLPGLAVEPGERIAIHAAADPAPFWDIWGRGHQHQGDAGRVLQLLHQLPGFDPDPDPLDGTSGLPLGAIVGTAVVAEVLPIIDLEFGWQCDTDTPERALVTDGTHAELLGPGPVGVDVTDQLPLGDYRPGRWAWVLADPGDGRCDPIPTRGAQGVWEWPLSRGSQPGEAS